MNLSTESYIKYINWKIMTFPNSLPKDEDVNILITIYWLEVSKVLNTMKFEEIR